MFLKHTYRKEADEGSDLSGDDTAVVDPPEDEGEDPAVIAKAEKMGWTPKDKFRGDPAKWRPAAEFLERGENMLPIVQATVKKQANKIAELEATMKQMGEYFTKSQKRAYDQALADIEEKQRKAIADGDGEAFQAASKDLKALEKDLDKPAEQIVAKASDPVYDKWADDNAKWLADDELEEYGTFYAQRLRSKGEKAQGREFLDLITKGVKAKFPEKFENPRRAAAPSVEGHTATRSKGKGYADLPSGDRAACDRMAKNAFPDNAEKQKEFKENYVKNYDWS